MASPRDRHVARSSSPGACNVGDGVRPEHKPSWRLLGVKRLDDRLRRLGGHTLSGLRPRGGAPTRSPFAGGLRRREPRGRSGWRGRLLAASASGPPPSRPTTCIRRLLALLEKLKRSCRVGADFLDARQYALGRKGLRHLLKHALGASHTARSQPRPQRAGSQHAEADEGRSDHQPAWLRAPGEGQPLRLRAPLSGGEF